jgi:homoserine kinase type II
MKKTDMCELEQIVERYDVGELVHVERNDRGYVNTSFEIETLRAGRRQRYFLRRYKRGIKAQELEFEHSLINHLVGAGLDLVAGVHSTREGKTFVRLPAAEDGEDVFYALFDFLPGEDRYTWVGPACTAEEIKSAARVLARYHSAVFGFQPRGHRDEPRIVELLSDIAQAVKVYPVRTKGTVFDACLLEHLEQILSNVEATRDFLDCASYHGLARLVVHCDYHPGNLKFQEERATGLFDFDWSKIDTRCFDVALALFYFFSGWHKDQAGALDLKGIRLFLNAYQRALAEAGELGPLSETELTFLPHMIQASNLYVLNWTLADYYGNDVDPEEYLIYLRHSVEVMQWLEVDENWCRLVKLFQTVRVVESPEEIETDG